MKAYDTISAEIENDIAVLRLNRPDKMNAMSTAMRAELLDAVRDAPARHALW